MKFYLGTHMASWLQKLDVPLFVSRRRMPKKRFKPARASWALDSGGFTELTLYGEWRISARDYVDEVRRYSEHVGLLDWAAIQDWMCEPSVIAGGTIAGRKAPGTHLSVEEHQRRTVRSLLELRGLAPDLPWTPVLQGWTLGDYYRCLDLYDAAGVDLTREPTVGIGSVCRRGATGQIVRILTALTDDGINAHGFGVKRDALAILGSKLTSADSLAWSFTGWRDPFMLKECREDLRLGRKHAKKSCSHCTRWALHWRRTLLEQIEDTQRQVNGDAA